MSQMESTNAVSTPSATPAPNPAAAFTKPVAKKGVVTMEIAKMGTGPKFVEFKEHLTASRLLEETEHEKVSIETMQTQNLIKATNRVARKDLMVVMRSDFAMFRELHSRLLNRSLDYASGHLEAFPIEGLVTEYYTNVANAMSAALDMVRLNLVQMSDDRRIESNLAQEAEERVARLAKSMEEAKTKSGKKAKKVSAEVKERLQSETVNGKQ